MYLSRDVVDDVIIAYTRLDDIYHVLPDDMFGMELGRRFGTPDWFLFVESKPEFAKLLVSNLDVLFPIEKEKYGYVENLTSNMGENWELVKELLLLDDKEIIDYVNKYIIKRGYPRKFARILVDSLDERIFEIMYKYDSGNILHYSENSQEDIPKLVDLIIRKGDDSGKEKVTEFFSSWFSRGSDNGEFVEFIMVKENRRFLIELFQQIDKLEE